MAITGRQTTADDVRNIEAGLLLLGAGAVMLFVSLFLDWYGPGLEAWSAFETWDLVLAATALIAVVAVAGRMGYGTPRPDSWLLGAVAVALVVVVVQLINPPPAARGLDPNDGLWLALAGAGLMALGAVLSVARISVAVNLAGPRASRPPAGAEPVADPVAPGLGGGRAGAGRRFARGPVAQEDGAPPYADEPAPAATTPTRPL